MHAKLNVTRKWNEAKDANERNKKNPYTELQSICGEVMKPINNNSNINIKSVVEYACIGYNVGTPVQDMPNNTTLSKYNLNEYIKRSESERCNQCNE